MNGCPLAAYGCAPDARYPLQQQALCSPFSLTPFTAQILTSPPERGKKKKRHSHTRKKVLATLQSLVDKTQRIKSTSKAGVPPLVFELLLFMFFFYFFSLFARREEVYTLAVIDWAFRLFLKPRALVQKKALGFTSLRCF